MIDIDIKFLLFFFFSCFFSSVSVVLFLQDFFEVTVYKIKTTRKMKPVLVFALACVAVALAVPIAEETANNGPAAVALEDIAQDSTAIVDSSNTELVRPKRFLLKKLALAKAGILGLGLVEFVFLRCTTIDCVKKKIISNN